MRHDTRLARMLHVLVHMHLLDGNENSETIALMLQTNAVVVRRVMGRLRESGLVTSTGGRGGGWKLARAAQAITARDVLLALDSGSVFAIGPSADHPDCPVERAVNATLGRALDSAQARLIDELGDTTLAELAAQVMQSQA
ncbi:Rrf2 family transcriptional regulator [Burkholderia sp. 22PA0099]|uniref:RrF2 family transcriptional regulator n=1 Tax=Burkholderia sp. 22PA0099 TaxID=3237372 RepID=UPI0039C1596F